MQDTTPADRPPPSRPAPGGVTRRARGRFWTAAAVLVAACAPATPARARAAAEGPGALQASDPSADRQGAQGPAPFVQASAPDATTAVDREAVEKLDWDDYDRDHDDDPSEAPDAEPEKPTGEETDAAAPAAAAEEKSTLSSAATVLPLGPEAAGSDASEPAPPVEGWTTDDLDAWQQERVGPRYFDNVDHAGKPASFACVRAAAYFPHLLRRYDVLGRCSFEESRQARRQFGEDAQVFCTRPSFAGCRLFRGVERFYYAYERRLRRTSRSWGGATEGAADLASTAGVPGGDAVAGVAVAKEGETSAPAGAP